MYDGESQGQWYGSLIASRKLSKRRQVDTKTSMTMQILTKNDPNETKNKTRSQKLDESSKLLRTISIFR